MYCGVKCVSCMWCVWCVLLCGVLWFVLRVMRPVLRVVRCFLCVSHSFIFLFFVLLILKLWHLALHEHAGRTASARGKACAH